MILKKTLDFYEKKYGFDEKKKSLFFEGWEIWFDEKNTLDFDEIIKYTRMIWGIKN